jgi:protein CpxP
MKKLIVMMMLVLGTFFSSRAQKIPTAEELAKKNIEEMDKRLKLTPTQRSVIYNYVFDIAKEQLALYKKQQAGTYKDEDETKFFKLQNETNKNIKTVLKPEQVIEYNKLTEERLSGIDPNKKKKKLKKGEEEEKVVGIEGLKSGNN